MASGSSAGNFKISSVPLSSSVVRRDPLSDEADALPSHYEKSLLLAIARNPRTLFVCWSVDWAAAFGTEVPADRKGHVKLKSDGSERTQALEPLSGNCSITDLAPGETYKIELGYYGPGNQWNVIACDQVMMPSQGAANDERINVATIPFHLSFQRLIDLFGGNNDLAQTLAEFEQRAAQNEVRNGRDEQLLRALELSSEDLKIAAAIREAMLCRRKSRPADHAGGSSFGGSSLG